MAFQYTESDQLIMNDHSPREELSAKFTFVSRLSAQILIERKYEKKKMNHD